MCVLRLCLDQVGTPSLTSNHPPFSVGSPSTRFRSTSKTLPFSSFCLKPYRFFSLSWYFGAFTTFPEIDFHVGFLNSIEQAKNFTQYPQISQSISASVDLFLVYYFSFLHFLIWVSSRMGKNQAYKAMQKARLGSSSGGPDEIEDGMMDGSFHSPEWHAARLASLETSHTITWEEYKKKQKEDELRKSEVEADKDKMMREYRAQLDAERASKLAHGRNYSSSKSNHKKEKRDRALKKRSSKKRKNSRRPSDSSSSSSESSSSDEEERESRRSKSRSKRTKKERKHRSKRRKHSSSDSEGGGPGGPLPLSRFFGSVKS